MNAKKSFWTLTVLIGLYAVIALRMQAGSAPPDAAGGHALQAQNGVAGVLNTLLLPASWGIGKVQNLFSHAPATTRTPDELDKIISDSRLLVNENQILSQENERLRQQLHDITAELPRFPALSHSRFLTWVNIVAYSASANTDTVTIDAGRGQEVKTGALVISDFAPVGQVISVGPTSSVVRLITDADHSMQHISTQIRRMDPRTGKFTAIVAAKCEVEGGGDGKLLCKSQSIYASAPQPGDRLVIYGDTTWRRLDGAFIGEIESVDRQSNPDLRFEIKIKPYADISHLLNVTVILD